LVGTIQCHALFIAVCDASFQFSWIRHSAPIHTRQTWKCTFRKRNAGLNLPRIIRRFIVSYETRGHAPL